MRITIEIDAALIEQAKLATGAKSQREVIEQGLKLLVAMHAQAQTRQLKGKIASEDRAEGETAVAGEPAQGPGTTSDEAMPREISAENTFNLRAARGKGQAGRGLELLAKATGKRT